MIVEVMDKESGAILFKKDNESLTIESLLKRVKALESLNSKLEKRIKKLESAEKGSQ